jgi:hypothetical protein
MQHDPLLDGGFNEDVYQMLEEILASTEHAPTHADVLFDGEIVSRNSKDNRHTVFLKSENAYFGVRLSASSRGFLGKSVVRYRGQPVTKLESKSRRERLTDRYFLNYTLDIWAGKADEWLTFDRSRLTALGVQKIDEMIERSLKQWVDINRSSLIQSNNHAIALSFLAHLRQSGQYDEGGFWTKIALELPGKWLESTCISPLGGVKNLGDILNTPENRFVSIGESFDKNELLNDLDLKSKYIFNPPALEAEITLCHWLDAQPVNGLRIHSIKPPDERNRVPRFLFELIPNCPDKIDVSREVQADLIAHCIFDLGLGGANRLLFPCFLLPEEIDQSKILLNEEVPVKGVISPFKVLPKGTLSCVLPFELPKKYFFSKNNRISLDRLSEFIDWVMENLADKTAKRSEVEAEYAKIIDYFNNDLMANNERWQSAIKRPIQLTEKTESSENE